MATNESRNLERMKDMETATLVRACFRQGSERHDVTYVVRGPITHDVVRSWSLVTSTTGDGYVDTLVDQLTTVGHGVLGWVDFRVTTLSEVMDFDHVIQVHADGRITEPRVTDAPEAVYDDALSGGTDWSLMTGRSGQYGYGGPTLHPSELIGGGLERDILGTPGQYVALVSYAVSDDDTVDDTAGWAIAYRAIGEGE